jgi:hypothetical protein
MGVPPPTLTVRLRIPTGRHLRIHWLGTRASWAPRLRIMRRDGTGRGEVVEGVMGRTRLRTGQMERMDTRGGG